MTNLDKCFAANWATGFGSTGRVSLYSPWVAGRHVHLPSEGQVVVQSGLDDFSLERLYVWILLGYLYRHRAPDLRSFLLNSAKPVNR